MKEEQIEYYKRQLEYIKEWFNRQEDAPFMEITYEYFVSLIEWSEERLKLIEKVQELEEELYNLKESAYQTQLDFLDANGKKNTCAEQNKHYREAMSIVLGMIQYNRTDKENEIYKLLGELLRSDD